MKGIRKKALSFFLTLLVCLSLLLSVSLGAEEGSGGETPILPEAEYWYDIEINKTHQPADPLCTWVDLYVNVSDTEAPVLHTGSVAIGVEATEILEDPGFSFHIADGYGMAAFDPTSGNGVERAVGPDGSVYLGFIWYTGLGVEPQRDASGRQWIGTLQLPYGRRGETVRPEDILIVPYCQTVSGQKLRGQLAAADPETQIDLSATIEDTWRMPDPAQPDVGYYQGYHRTADGSQRRVDIGANAWRKGLLRVIAYNPQNAITIALYRQGEDGSYPNTAEYRLQSTAKTGVGRYVETFRFPDGVYLDLETNASVTAGDLPEGTYRLVIGTLSHVKATINGVTIAPGNLFPELTGFTVTLPCGDVDGSGTIRQLDRAYLTMPGRYGTAADAGSVYDLDGDRRIDQEDLAILIAPENYGKTDFVYLDFEESVGDNGYEEE